VLIGAVPMAMKTTLALAASALLGVSLLLWKPWESAASAAAAAPVELEHSLASEPHDIRSPRAGSGSGLESARNQQTPSPRAAQASSPQARSRSPRRIPSTAAASVPLAWLAGSGASRRTKRRRSFRAAVRARRPGPRLAVGSRGRNVDRALERAHGHWRSHRRRRRAERERRARGAARSCRARSRARRERGARARRGGLRLEFRRRSRERHPVARRRRRPVRPARPRALDPDRSLHGHRARASGRTTSREWEAVGQVGDTAEIVLRLFGPAGGLRGRVLDESGAPIAGANIEFPGGGCLAIEACPPRGCSSTSSPGCAWRARRTARSRAIGSPPVGSTSRSRPSRIPSSARRSRSKQEEWPSSRSCSTREASSKASSSIRSASQLSARPSRQACPTAATDCAPRRRMPKAATTSADCPRAPSRRSRRWSSAARPGPSS
jgi:hypothetical protein